MFSPSVSSNLTSSPIMWLCDLIKSEWTSISIGVFLLLIAINAAAIVLNRIRRSTTTTTAHPLRSGFLRPIFYLVLFSHLFLALVLPAIFLLSSFLHRHAVHSLLPIGTLLLAIGIHAKFWLLAGARLWANRCRHEPPLTLVFSYAVVCLTLLVPLPFWHTFFPNGINEPYFVCYLLETVAAFFILFSVLSGAALKRTAESRWQNGVQRVVEIWPYVWPKKSRGLQLIVLACLVLLAVGRVLNVLIPLYSKWIVDALSGPQPQFCWKLIAVASALKYLQGSGAQGGLLNTVRDLLWLPVEQYTTLEIETELLRQLHSLSLRWHLSRHTGEVIRVKDRGVGSIYVLLNYVLFNVVPSLLDILFASVFFFTNFNFYFGLLVSCTMVIYLVLTIVISEWRIKHRREMNELDKRASAIGVDSLINYETIKHFNAEDLETQRYREAYVTYQKAEIKTTVSLSALNLCQNSIIGFGMLSGSLLAAYLISTSRTMSAGDYVLFTTYLLQLYGPLNFFGSIYRTIQRSFVDMENMMELFRQEIEIKDVPGAKELEKRPGSIEFRNVSFAYVPEKPILQDLSFVVNPGETVALVGPSGSGKTTTIRLLFRLYDVCEGAICFNGTDIRALKTRSLRDKIAIVPQDTVLFNETIRYNIRYGRPEASDEDVEEAAKAAAIHQFILTHPDGYNCLVGERGLKLSGGEKQRVAIARAVLKRPEYILLDEATSALDSRTERAIQQNLLELCQRRTCVVVAHRLSTIIHADKILVLSGGRVVESGSHEQLLGMDGLYAEMWRLQNGKAAAAEATMDGDNPTTATSSGTNLIELDTKPNE